MKHAYIYIGHGRTTRVYYIVVIIKSRETDDRERQQRSN